MKIKNQKQFKRGIALALVGMFFNSACATTNYASKQSGMIKIMPKGYERGDQFFKRGMAKGGLVKAAEPNEEALVYAKKSSKNAKWSHGLLLGGLAAVLGGIYTATLNEPVGSKRETVGLSIYGAGLVAILGSIFPALKSRASESDAINKYNDDLLQKLAPQVFTTPVKEEQKSKVDKKYESSSNQPVIDVQKGTDLE